MQSPESPRAGPDPDPPSAAAAAEERARRMPDRMRSVALAGSGVIGARTIERLQQVLQDACARTIRFDVFALGVYDAEGDTLSFTRGQDLGTFVPPYVVPLAGTPSERVIRQRKTLVTLSSSDPAGDGAVLVGSGRRSESVIRAPLLAEDRALGVLCVQSYTPDLYTAEDVEVLETLAALGATAFLNIQYLAEREEAEKAVRESEERFRHLVTSLPAIVYVVEAEPPFHPLYVSPAAESLGYPLSEWSGHGDHWIRILHPEDRERVLEHTMAAQRAGTPLDYEYRVVARDGTVHWMHDVGSFVRDAAGRPLYWQGVMMDVTTQREAERAAREGERRYRALFEEVPVGLYRTTAEGEFLDANPALAAILGYPDADALRRTSALGAYVDPEDRTRWRAVLQRDRVVNGYVIRLRKLDGSTIRARHSARAAFGADGALLYYEGAVEDITDQARAEEALRESEEYFRILTEHSSEVVAVLNEDGTIRYSSAERDDPDRPSAADGPRPAIDTVHPDDAELARETFRRTLEVPGGTRTAVLRVKQPGGGWRTQEVTAKNLLDVPPVNGVVVNSRDITERLELEEQLRQASRMEAVGKLAGGIAHDFNNLLTAIRGNADLLLDDLPQGDPAREEVDEIRTAADRAAELTHQLLAFSRRQVLKPQVLRLNERIEPMEKILSRLIGADIEIVARLDPWLGEVTADPAQVEQVIVNLALNARDAMPHGGVLTLETANVDVHAGETGQGPNVVPGAYVQLCVTDTGSGIAPEVLPHIFEPFYTTKPVGAGTGLGLATVYGVVEQSGGYVWAETWTGRATRFTILLPRTGSAGGAHRAPHETPNGGGQGGTLLLVEDEPSVRLLARRVLTRLGYSVLEASNGEEAIRVAGAHRGPIDLLVTDVVMPRMGGPEAARSIRASRPGIAVVYMSGYAEGAIATGGVLEAGTRLLQKPFTPAVFAATIREALAAAPRSAPSAQM